MRHTAGTYNAIIAHDLLHLFPPAAPAWAAREVLIKAIAADQARGKAHTGYHLSVEERRAIVDEAAPVLKQVSSLIDGGLPIGTPGRVDYFPVGDNNPSEGDLLIAHGQGTAKHGWPRLPNGWTADYLINLGGRLNTAEMQQDDSTALRSGQVKVSAAKKNEITKLRTRMREMLEGWFGNGSAELLAFGFQPRKAGPGRRPKAKTAAAKTRLASAKAPAASSGSASTADTGTATAN